MPYWIYIYPTKEKRMPGIMGPYSGFEARRVSDKIETRNEVVGTVSKDPVRAKREIKRKIIEENSYEIGSKRISSKNPITEEND